MSKKTLRTFGSIISLSLVAILPIFSSNCSKPQATDFSKYNNINDVINETDGWNKTLNSDFSNGALPLPWKVANDCGRTYGGVPNSFYWTHNCIDKTSDDTCLTITETEPTSHRYETSAMRTCPQNDDLDPNHAFDQAFGYWECDCTYCNNYYGWDSFYLNSDGTSRNDKYNGQDGSEIDIFESCWINQADHSHSLSNLHCNNGTMHNTETAYDVVDANGSPVDLYAPPSGINYTNSAELLPQPAFHKWGILWTPERYYFYVDRILQAESYGGNIGISQVPEYAVFGGFSLPSRKNWAYGDKENFETFAGKGAIKIKNFSVYQNTHFLPYVKQQSDFN